MQKSVEPKQALLWTMHDLTAQLQIGRNMAYTLMNEGLPVLRFGRSIRFDPDAVKQWLKEYAKQCVY
ncbi:helix-turn-helix domain-containing protein [Ktedonobacter robiniae]|uniref:Helix-turn-helix domain-containing protein n=1 Tax=Ktedonobacter robiniae TaxID=2778365 RepID=A0ABQ3UHH3_9CHLR|nr:helix-turn-helix domain-containing protein [Ktedonobacter robiniae]GHO52155.1 hypothetical protein KSB_06300 [Ktedonobacter robiniae]